jgi:formylmethanofuran dehydrogenase subunit E
MYTDGTPEDIWGQLARLHPRLCPRQVLGVRIGQYAGELLGLALPRSDKQLLAFVETDGCFADGVSAATGCWLGHRTLRLVDHGKVAASFVDLRTNRAVRIWPNPRARMLADRRVPGAASRWHAQLEGYRTIPAEELLRAGEVVLAMPMAAVVGRPGERTACATCGEEILNQRHVIRDGAMLCRSCGGAPYLTYTGAEVRQCGSQVV